MDLVMDVVIHCLGLDKLIPRMQYVIDRMVCFSHFPITLISQGVQPPKVFKIGFT